MFFKLCQYNLGELMLLHVLKCPSIEDILLFFFLMQQLKKVYAALGFCTFKPGKKRIAYMGTVACFSCMTCASIIGMEIACMLDACFKRVLI